MAAEGRRGLGRGLSALLGEVEGPASASAREIPIELIRSNPSQPRVDFDEDELEELAQSLRQKGVLQPILVRPMRGTDGEFQIVAGERRWRAAQRAGLSAMPAVVRELGDLETLEIALIENIQRADLNPIEEASAFQALMGLGQVTQEGVAEAVGKSRSHVANTMRLLQLPSVIQTLVRSGKLSAGHARAIIGAADPIGLARKVMAAGLNVRETESLVRQEAEGGKSPPAPRPRNADTLALERDLSDRLGLHVTLADRNGAGEVRIRYQSLEQLDDLCRRLMRG